MLFNSRMNLLSSNTSSTPSKALYCKILIKTLEQMTRQFIILGEITFAQLVKIYSLGSPSVFAFSLARLVLTIFVMVLSSMEINVNTINQPRARMRVYRANSRLLMPYQARQSNIKSIVERPLIQSPDVDLYLSLSAYIQSQKFTSHFGSIERKRISSAIHRCNTRRSCSHTRSDIRIFRGKTHGGQIFTTFFGVDQLCKLIPNSNVETLKARRFKACIYVYLQGIVLSFARERVSDDFTQ